ncbi:MAG: hypothetical protein M1820_008065 [Bogoriella megaspora]|nr:MAG: hypothetical protein M1820_008065 [Bogoriella megaspora]
MVSSSITTLSTIVAAIWPYSLSPPTIPAGSSPEGPWSTYLNSSWPSSSNNTSKVTIPSQRFPGASISYKRTHICETTPGVKSFSGYVHLPSNFLADAEVPGAPYDINTFFWYFESRNDPTNAPTAIYFAGGPGQASTDAILDGEAGPCIVQDDSRSTVLNKWSWNNNVNMLYIDQPNMAGFSYDTIVNASYNLITGEITPLGQGVTTTQNQTNLFGKFASQNPNNTIKALGQGARAVWHFAQLWFQEFPEWKTTDKTISLWGNSYGGLYTPSYGSFIQSQNLEISNHSLGVANATILPIDTIGITNGCIDPVIEAPYYPMMAFNNTYGFQAYPQAVFEEALNNFTKPGGCHDLANQCRELGAASDLDVLGLNSTVNEACAGAFAYCFGAVQGAYLASNRSAFDMAQLNPAAAPTGYHIGFLNDPSVQEALGVPVNYTQDTIVAANNLEFQSGDPFRHSIADLNFLLSRGVKVTMIYGDRDYRCNWQGAQAVSLAADYPNAAKFRTSGYENITTNESYTGGVVRQYGGFSFSRVFESGHSVQFFQPETVSRIFDRAMLNKDVATGTLSTLPQQNGTVYGSKGPESSFWIKNKLPASQPARCYFWELNTTCNEAQLEALVEGKAVVQDLFVVDPPN